eukprot:SM000717S21384  [mRNA]  locus=s717:1197:2170:- [translate_table: standard]
MKKTGTTSKLTNVFGASKKATGFIQYSGKGFSVQVPAKWNPSKEVEYPGEIARWEDNFDATNNMGVIVRTATKSNITDYGSPEKFLDEVSFLLGKQSYNGKTASEGGFEANIVASASVLETSTATIDGRPYYKLSLLSRTADGDEGGKHQLITATIKDGKLWIMRTQAGDKRWFKGAKRFVEGADSSFSVA